MKGVVRPPSAKKRATHIGNAADAPSEIYGDDIVASGEDKHLMQLAEDESVEMADLIDAVDFIAERDAGWSNYDAETKSFY